MKIKDRILKELQRFVNRLLKAKGYEYTPEAPQDPGDPPGAQETAIPEASQTEDIEIISFGSPNCGKAKQDPDTQIKELKVGEKGLSYKWAKGSLRNWGIKDDHEARALAIMGYGTDGKKYRCAKADWISTDRSSRSFENIDSGYNGFNGKEFRKAAYKCFFIMSVDGKKRTNVLTTFRPLN